MKNLVTNQVIYRLRKKEMSLWRLLFHHRIKRKQKHLQVKKMLNIGLFQRLNIMIDKHMTICISL